MSLQFAGIHQHSVTFEPKLLQQVKLLHQEIDKIKETTCRMDLCGNLFLNGKKYLFYEGLLGVYFWGQEVGQGALGLGSQGGRLRGLQVLREKGAKWYEN